MVPKKLKRKYQLVLIVICILCAIALFFFEENATRLKTHFPIRQVTVEGVYWRVPQQAVKAIITPYAKRGYFFANLFSLRHKLQEELPWIQSASVAREWPDKILVTLTQKNAVATLNHSSLVTSSGEVFAPSLSSFPPDLPIFIGPPEKAKEILEQYHVFTSVLNSANLSIIQLQLSPDGNWSVELSNKIVVMLGDKDILTRFKRFIKVYVQVFVPQHREPGNVDMRYSHGMAVNWKI